MTQLATNVIVLEPAPARHIALSPDAGGQKRPRRTRKNMSYAGFKAQARLSSMKYGHAARSEIGGIGVRLLTPEEIDEWYSRLDRILNGKGQVRQQPRYRKAVV